MTQFNLDANLMKPFSFDEMDLQKNAQGLLGRSQQERVHELLRMQGGGKKAAWLSLVIVCWFFAFIIAVYNETKLPAEEGAIVLCFAGVIGLAFLLAISWFYLHTLSLRLKWIRIIEGPVTLKTERIKNFGSITSVNYVALIKRIRFELTKNQLEALRPGESLRVFYINNPPVHCILSVTRQVKKIQSEKHRLQWTSANPQ